MFSFRDVHSAAVTVCSVRLHDRVIVNGSQVSHRPCGDAARLARRRHARHPAPRRRCTGTHKLQLQITERNSMFVYRIMVTYRKQNVIYQITFSDM